MARPIHPVVVGTAGHVDHGKSSLVRQLTGIDPDRLQEEKDRGLTIDLGFARFKLPDGRYVGLVDVPGHERFVRNMVAGATGIDIALLVVAADDGVMPQTREHVDILTLLGVRRAMVALTKVDLVDEELASLAEDDVGGLLEGTPLAGAQVFRVSSETGEGIEELMDGLREMASSVEPRPAAGAFRMPIQRVFVLDGIGRVVTGIPMSGALRPGDTVQLLPGGETFKVRGLHAYGGKVERVLAGHSSALAVPDAKGVEIHRGMVVAEPGRFHAGEAIDVRLDLLGSAPRLRHRELVRFHVGTAEVAGVLLLLDREQVAPGDTECLARLILQEPVCCGFSDRFLLRMQTPVITVGGGEVLRVGSAPRRYRRLTLAQELDELQRAGSAPEARLRNLLEQLGPRGVSLVQAAQRLDLTAGDVQDVVDGDEGVHLHGRGKHLFLRSTLDAGVQELRDSIDRMLKSRPQAASVRKAAVRSTHTLPDALKEAVVDHLVQLGAARTLTRDRLLLVERLQPLPAADQRRLEALVQRIDGAAFRPPMAAELLEGDPGMEGLLARGEDEGLLEPIGEAWWSAERVRQAAAHIVENCNAHDGILDIPALRDQLDTSRKWLIPLLEHLDGTGLTLLQGGVRRLRNPDALSGGG